MPWGELGFTSCDALLLKESKVWIGEGVMLMFVPSGLRVHGSLFFTFVMFHNLNFKKETFLSNINVQS